jgi:hypothetical protein
MRVGRPVVTVETLPAPDVDHLGMILYDRDSERYYGGIHDGAGLPELLPLSGGGGGGTDPEVVRDTMATALVAGTGLTITVNDPADTITLALLRRYAANFVIDGGGSAITTGIKGDLVLETAGVIESWTILADQSGSVQIDLWKDTYTNYPPVVGDAITGSAKPILSSALKAQSSTLSGWTTSVAAGDIIRVNVDSVTTVQRVTLALKIREG